MKTNKTKQLKGLFSDSVIYGISGIISSFIGIFLIPIYTRIFEPKDYGVIGLLGTTFAIVYMLVVFNMDNTMTVWYWRKNEDGEIKRTLNTWLVFLAGTSFIAGIQFILFAGFWSKLILQSGEYAILLKLFGANICLTAFQKVVNIWYRMKRKPVHAVSYSLVIVLLTIGLNILLIVKWRWGLKGSYTAQVIASLFGFIACILILRNWINLKYFSWERLKEMLIFSTPLLPASLLFWVMNSTSTYFLNFYSSKTEVGLFQIGSAVAGVLNLLIWAFMQAWSPFAMSISKNEDAPQVYSLVLELYCIIGFLAVFILALFAEDILRIFTNEKYLGSKNVISILALNVLLLGIPQILSIANAIAGSSFSYAKAIVVGAFISVILYNILIPIWGKEGAALSILAGNLVVPFYHAKMVQKLYPIPYNFKRILLGCVIICVFFVLGFSLVNLTGKYHVDFVVRFIIALAGIASLLFFYRKVVSWKTIARRLRSQS